MRSESFIEDLEHEFHKLANVLGTLDAMSRDAFSEVANLSEGFVPRIINLDDDIVIRIERQPNLPRRQLNPRLIRDLPSFVIWSDLDLADFPDLQRSFDSFVIAFCPGTRSRPPGEPSEECDGTEYQRHRSEGEVKGSIVEGSIDDV